MNTTPGLLLVQKMLHALRGNSNGQKAWRMASPQELDPLRLLRAIRYHGPGVVLILLAACAPRAEPVPKAQAAPQTAPQTVDLNVYLPDPGYRKADGSIMRHDEFSGTKLMWGTCDTSGDLLELRGESSVVSWRTIGLITVPVYEAICIVAVVMGLDGQPMGRSDPARFYARPGGVQELRIE